MLKNTFRTIFLNTNILKCAWNHEIQLSRWLFIIWLLSMSIIINTHTSCLYNIIFICTFATGWYIQKKGKLSHFLKVQFERIQNRLNSIPKSLFCNIRHSSHIRSRNESVNDRTLTYVHNAQNTAAVIVEILPFVYLMDIRLVVLVR